jgi:hypothetical protein
LDPEPRTFLPRLAGELLTLIPLNHVIIQFLASKADDFLAKGELFISPRKVQSLVPSFVLFYYPAEDAGIRLLEP